MVPGDRTKSGDSTHSVQHQTHFASVAGEAVSQHAFLAPDYSPYDRHGLSARAHPHAGNSTAVAQICTKGTGSPFGLPFGRSPTKSLIADCCHRLHWSS